MHVVYVCTYNPYSFLIKLEPGLERSPIFSILLLNTICMGQYKVSKHIEVTGKRGCTSSISLCPVNSGDVGWVSTLGLLPRRLSGRCRWVIAHLTPGRSTAAAAAQSCHVAVGDNRVIDFTLLHRRGAVPTTLDLRCYQCDPEVSKPPNWIKEHVVLRECTFMKIEYMIVDQNFLPVI